MPPETYTMVGECIRLSISRRKVLRLMHSDRSARRQYHPVSRSDSVPVLARHHWTLGPRAPPPASPQPDSTRLREPGVSMTNARCLSRRVSFVLRVAQRAVAGDFPSTNDCPLEFTALCLREELPYSR